MESMQRGAGLAVALIVGAIIALPILYVVLLVWPAHAAPPENADPALIPWFNSLTNKQGGHCCGPETDCRPVAYRVSGDHYEALLDPAVHKTAAVRSIIEPQWIVVPPEQILERQDNPTGRAIMCWRPYYAGEDASAGVLCFVRPSEA